LFDKQRIKGAPQLFLVWGSLTNTVLQREEAIINFVWQLKKDGLSNTTINNYSKSLEALINRGASLLEPDTVKNVIASSAWSASTRTVIVAAYQKYAMLNSIKWTPPKYTQVRKLPFIPLESEIDAFIACAGRKMSALLQCLKETGARIGEALRIEWTDIDFEKRIVNINHPEKHGNVRGVKVSDKLIAMLCRLPRADGKVFTSSIQVARNSFCTQRKHAAQKLGNARILQIHFHTFRHWKATMEYHRTKDILHVMRLLGHKSIANTLIYTQLVEFEEDDKYCTAIADNVEQARKLLEVGFEYICTHKDEMLFRKRK
jgi:integrase